MTHQGEMHRVIDRVAGGRIAHEGHAFPADKARELAAALSDAIDGEVRFADGDRALYSTDASNYRQPPIGVVIPRTVEDVVETVDLCRRFDAPVTPRGGGTALAGQTCNTTVILDFSKHLNRILHLDPDNRLAQVEPGCVLDVLRGAAERHHLTFGPDPATHDRNTLGGMIGNNSCGVHSVMAGRTSDNVRDLEVLTYDGVRMRVGPTSADDYRRIVAGGGRRAEIYRGLREFWDTWGHAFNRAYPQIPRRVSGYENLDQLAPENGFNVARALVGTEATCALVLSATLELVHSPPCRVLVLIGFSDVCAAADHVPEVLSHAPIALEGLDDLLVSFMRRKGLHAREVERLPNGSGWLLVEFGGPTAEDAAGQGARLVQAMQQRGHAARLVSEPAAQAEIWTVREAGLAATAHVPGEPEAFPGWEDSAVRREDLGDYLRDLRALFRKYGYLASVYGHFGDGLVHCRIPFDLKSEAGVAAWRRFLDEAADLVVRYGGSISGEHGDGQARGALLDRMYGPELLQAQRAFRAIWDPGQRMNPGKLLDPYPIDANLRIGPGDPRPETPSVFAYREDGGSFRRATERCVGVGACRRRDSETGIMCPSYMATGEERHSTRGRARLLFEMLRGDLITKGWRSQAVEDALDLCLACKGCKRDCPVHVDMASYKAEFRSRHYAGRLRPRAAYAMGRIERLARYGSGVPWLVNAVLRTPGLSRVAKAAGGIAPERSIPALADQPFRRWHARRPRTPAPGRKVLLWPDTFNNYFRPQVAISATRVLEHLGFEVLLPREPLCCGRPLYDWGWLEEAKRLWRRTLDCLRREITAGIPVIGLEPACTSAFRDELPNLFPHDPTAQALSRQTFLLGEFLDQHISADLPEIGGEALVQMHCHHHAVLDPDAEARVLGRAGVDATILASGCCGMAGAFGFESGEKFEMSQVLAERVLLPSVRAADPATVILANGFSCREQIEQGTGRPTLHLAELLARQLP